MTGKKRVVSVKIFEISQDNLFFTKALRTTSPTHLGDIILGVEKV